MRRTRKRQSVTMALWLIATALAGGGCVSPPSVEPLLRAADGAMADEQRLLNDDAARFEQWFEQQRQTMRAAYAADLAARPAAELDRAWVQAGTDIYVLARESLLRHELELHRQNETRRRNLRLAGHAVRQALALIQQQDRLFERVPDVRRWLNEQAAAAGATGAPGVTNHITHHEGGTR